MTTTTHRMRPVQPTRNLLFAPTIIFIVAALFRLPYIGSRPGWEWDESSYTNIARNWMSGNGLVSAPEFGIEAEKFLYHPPFHSMLLGTWFKVFGAGVTQARVLGAIMALIAITLLYMLAKRVIGHKPALVLYAALAIDPWTVYANRTSWMENMLIVLVVAGMLLYWRAIQRGTAAAYYLAGIGLGAAVVYKHTGAYVLLAVFLYYLVTKKDFKKHLVLLGGVLGTVSLYLLVMSAVFGELYWDITGHQWLRTIGSTSVNLSGNGSIKGIRGLVEPIMAQYKVFAATLIVMATAISMWLFRLVQAIKNRSLDNIRANAFAFTWMTAGLSFAFISMKFPSYLLTILIAMYFYVASEVVEALRNNPYGRLKKAIVAGMVLLALAGITGSYVRLVSYGDNAIAAVGKFAQKNIPANAVVLTEQPIGNLIGQPFCDIRAHARKCGGAATWVITYTSANYDGPDDAKVREILSRSTRVWSETGFKETLTVYRVN